MSSSPPTTGREIVEKYERAVGALRDEFDKEGEGS
jgi:hypothetical protein